jgi:hypothetical protein
MGEDPQRNMGLGYSRARVAVNSVVDAGIKDIVNQVQRSSLENLMEQSIVCENCDICRFDHVSQRMFYKINFSQVASQMQTSSVKTDINQAISAQARASVEGGLGLQGADADTAINTLTSIGQELINTAESVFKQKSFLSQTIRCSNSKLGEFSYISQDMTTDLIVKNIVSQGSFNEAMIKIVNTLDALADVKTKGYDPVGSLAMIAIAIMVGFLAFMFGGAYAGVNILKNIVSSPKFWVLLLGISSLMCAFPIAAQFADFWPHQRVDAIDTPHEAKGKESTNKMVTMASSVGLVSSLVGLSIISYVAFIRR